MKRAALHENLLRRKFFASHHPGVAVLQEGRKSEDVQVLSIAKELGKGCPDETWIPTVAQQHGVVVTQDINIHRMRGQWQLCEANKVGIFFVEPSTSGWNYWSIVELLIKWWPRLKETAKAEKRPFGRVISSSRARWREL